MQEAIMPNNTPVDITALQRDCIHNWGEPIFDPIEIEGEELILGQLERRDSEIHPVYSFHKARQPRWRQVCKKCLKEKYTFTEPH
jgi:hypothetical protein